MKLDVIIPVLNLDFFTKQLLTNILDNTVQPDNIFIIDNGSNDNTRDVCFYFSQYLPIIYLPQETNIGVNPSWNLGFSKTAANLISVLNNDIVISTRFFEKVKETFSNNPLCGIAVPNTIPLNSDIIENHHNNTETLIDREGWAFTIKKEIIDQSGPIPEEFKIFFGDDFLFKAAKDQGYECYKMIDNKIHHFLSQTVMTTGLGVHQAPEHVLWRKKYEQY